MDDRRVGAGLHATGEFDRLRDGEAVLHLIPSGTADFAGEADFAADGGDEEAVAGSEDEVLVARAGQQIIIEVDLNRLLAHAVEAHGAEGADIGGSLGGIKRAQHRRHPGEGVLAGSDGITGDVDIHDALLGDHETDCRHGKEAAEGLRQALAQLLQRLPRGRDATDLRENDEAFRRDRQVLLDLLEVAGPDAESEGIAGADDVVMRHRHVAGGLDFGARRSRFSLPGVGFALRRDDDGGEEGSPEAWQGLEDCLRGFRHLGPLQRRGLNGGAGYHPARVGALHGGGLREGAPDAQGDQSGKRPERLEAAIVHTRYVLWIGELWTEAPTRFSANGGTTLPSEKKNPALAWQSENHVQKGSPPPEAAGANRSIRAKFGKLNIQRHPRFRSMRAFSD